MRIAAISTRLLCGVLTALRDYRAHFHLTETVMTPFGLSRGG
jgi:hypothetical protein